VVGVDVLTERQATHATPGEALGAQPLDVVFCAFAALCRHGENAAVNADSHRHVMCRRTSMRADKHPVTARAMLRWSDHPRPRGRPH
jgi:hypothetical protein